MIPAGRIPIGADRAARLHGMALKTALNKKLFDQGSFPEPLTAGRRKRIWDEAQVRAHANGEPVPVIPAAAPHPDDLLERAEAAAEWGVTPTTWDTYMVDGYTPEPDLVVEGRELWRRGTLQEYPRPGQGAGGGRPRGSRAPRVTGPKSERLAQVRQALDEAAGDTTTAQLIARIKEATGVSQSTAHRLLREVRDERRED